MITFDDLKNEIQKIQQHSLVQKCLDILNYTVENVNLKYPVWEILVLIKWAYLHTDNDENKNIATSESLELILDQIRQYGGSHSETQFINSQDISRFFRILAYQQFPLQEEYHNALIDRQIVLYTQIVSKADFQNVFEIKTGLTIEVFLRYCYLTHLILFADTVMSNVPRVTKFNIEEFLGFSQKVHEELFSKKFNKVHAIKYIELLTIFNQEEFFTLQKLSNEKLQIFESNLFTTKPFLFINDDFIVIYRPIFIQTIKHFIYTFLKANYSEFTTEFGKKLETYIEMGLKEMNIVFLKENELKKKYSLTKVSDFYVEKNVLIECKAIDLHPRSGVIRVPDILTKEFKDSIIKAYCQLLSTAAVIDGETVWYGLVVTYSDLYLGFGLDAWEEFLQMPIESYAKLNGLSTSTLPPENLFFIDITFWDYLVQIVKDKKATLAEILDKAKEMTTGSKKLFNLEMVLRNNFKIDKIQIKYLDDAHKLIFN